ncbi:MAG: type II secretion system F family protein [Candidatus Bathyarchaeota archaeon]|nr:type II secretion system F family protein [Candidatus Bathyarchaeota archaeon]
MAKASLKVVFEAYMGLVVFASIVVGAVTLTLTAVISQSIIFAVLFGLVATFVSFGVGYLYPFLNISSRSKKIEANLPLTANFMAVLASSGMPPERVFRSLANVGDEFGIGQEARRIIMDIELLGLDLNAALKNASARSPSRKFSAMLDGIVTTSHMGGDLSAYLRDEADKFKKAKVASMKSYLEALGGMAEVYVSFLIALPLALVVMLSIMAFLGGGASMMGNIDPQVILTILAFVITPSGVGVLLLILDSMTPPR